jgi:peptidyl-prolyl cis-trans isomerase B (cyclophilin B)
MQTKVRGWLMSLLLVAALFLGSCGAPASVPSSTSSASASDGVTESAATATPAPSAGATQASDLPRLNGKATVEMVVKGSTVTIEVDGTNAPVTAGNFVDLVNRGVYDGLSFHRVVREPQPFVVQGGDPQSKDPSFAANLLGTGGFIDPATSQPRYIPLEIKPEGAQEPIYSKTLQDAGVTQPPVLKHTRGAVAMARSQFPDSASSQFYFALADLSFLDGNYAVFGSVTDGMEGVDRIQQGDRIESAKVTIGLDNLQNGGAAQ